MRSWCFRKERSAVSNISRLKKKKKENEKEPLNIAVGVHAGIVSLDI